MLALCCHKCSTITACRECQEHCCDECIEILPLSGPWKVGDCRSVFPTEKGPVHEAHHPTHPPTHPSVCNHCNLGRAKRGVESTPKTGVEIRSGLLLHCYSL